MMMAGYASESDRNPSWSIVSIPTYDVSDIATHDHVISKYIEKRVMGAASLNLLLATFDFIGAACRDRDSNNALKGIVALERSLDFSRTPDLAHLFLAIYRYCRQLIGEKRFEDAFAFLGSLRDSWEEAKNSRHGYQVSSG